MVRIRTLQKMFLQSSAFQIYNASAGSGKTYQLAKNYLRLILAPNSPFKYRELLALTFTNKAVGEMKDRILQYLQEFSFSKTPEKSQSLFEELQQDLGYNATELRTKAATTLKELLHNYGFFEISTIDKFNHKIIRTFARDLKIAQNFEVELDTDSLLQEAVLRILDKAGHHDALTATLIRFSLEKIDDNKSWNIAFDLNQMGKMLFNENHAPYLKKFHPKSLADFDALKNRLQREIQRLEKQAVSLAEEVLETITTLGFEFADFPRETLPNHFRKIAAGETNINFLYKNKIEEQLNQNKILKTSIEKPSEGLVTQIAPMYLQVKSILYALKAYKKAAGAIMAVSLLNEIQKEVKEVQSERNLLAISDFNTIISEEVTNQPVPFIYERLGEKYRHFFIDEFQDTSIKQWSNLVPLIGNALESMDEHGETGSLLLVGDVKQAIYRWRGGEASQFLDLSIGKTNPFTVAPNTNQLNKNWRSCKTIINFNNSFFTFINQLFTKSEFQELFIDGNRQETNDKSGGYVNISYHSNEIGANGNPQCKKTLETIKKIKSLGYPYRDICILVRENRKGELLANFLAQQGIPLVSADVLLLKNSPEVQFLVALLKYLEAPNEKLYRFELLSYLCPEEQPLHDFLDRNLQKMDAFLADHYDFDPNTIVLLSTYDVLELAIQRFDLAKNSNAYINYFLDTVLDYGNKEGAAIYDFLSYWELKQDSLALSAPEHLDAVKIMTIHKAKGLEFPFVIFPFADSPVEGGPIKNDVWVPIDKTKFEGFEHLVLKASPELEFFSRDSHKLYMEEKEKTLLDSINVLYVALTRAIQGLFVLCENGKGTKITYGSLLKSFCETQQTERPNEHEFAYGSLEAKSKVLDTIQEEKNIPYIYSSKFKYENNPVRLASSLHNGKNDEARSRGNVIHDLLAKVYSPEDVAKAVGTLVANGLIPYTEASAYEEIAWNVVSHEKLSNYFDKNIKSLNEIELLDTNGAVLRPDKMVIYKEEVVLIDYKTGAQSTSHKNQLRQYEEIVSKMGYFVTHKILVYINESITPIFV